MINIWRLIKTLCPKNSQAISNAILSLLTLRYKDLKRHSQHGKVKNRILSKDVKAPYGYRTYYLHLRKNALSVIFVQKWRWKWMIFVWSIVTIFSNKLGITYKTMSMPVFLDSSSYTNAKSSRKNLIKIPFFHLSVTKQPHKLLIFPQSSSI